MPGLAIGLGLGLTMGRGGGWTPAALFVNGEQGAWYDPSDSSTVFQDAAGTTPAGEDDPVGRIEDKSGNGNHATQSTSAARPTLRKTAGGLWYLDFDGTDDQLGVSGIALSGASGATLFYAGRAESSGSFFNAFAYAGAVFRFAFDTRPAADYFLSDPNEVFAAGSYTISQDVIVTGRSVIDGALILRVDGSQLNSVASSGTGYSNGDLVIGNATGSPVRLDGRFYGGALIGRGLTADEMTSMESYLAAKTGVTL